jgi:RNA polymerase sigma-70 factor (ECF subfamily)
MESAERSLGIQPLVNWDAAAHDEELMHAAKAGCEMAFEELQRMYAQRLYKRILSITRNHEDAEDALQDTFMHAYLGLRSFEGRSTFSTWLTRIAINSALMSIRKRRSRPEVSFEGPSAPESESACFDIRDNGLNPEQLCDQNQRCAIIRRAIHTLDPKLRTPISMRMSKEKSLKEIALELDVSVASAKSRLHRARKRLARSHPLLVAKAS